MIPGSALLKNTTKKSINFRHFFNKITFSTDFDKCSRKKKGTIGKYRWFPIDWPLYEGSSIVKKSFAEPLHLSFSSDFQLFPLKKPFLMIGGEALREALLWKSRKRHMKDEYQIKRVLWSSGSAMVKVILAVPPPLNAQGTSLWLFEVYRLRFFT